MHALKVCYYWLVRLYYIFPEGAKLSRAENSQKGKWVVEYTDGARTRPSFWDVAHERASQEDGSKIIYIGPGANYLR